jgi:hypothetical protein
MLLESLLKHTAADHPDFEALTTALKIVSDKANEINQKMALASQQRKTMELSSRFGALPLEETLVQPYRHFVTEFIFNSYNNVNEHSTKRYGCNTRNFRSCAQSLTSFCVQIVNVYV